MPDAIPLWPTNAQTDAADAPTLTPYLADGAADGGLVVVCPGGGYGHLAHHEGEPVARWLNEHGINAAVLRYRLGPRHRHPAMIHDAQRAIRLARDHARQWNLTNPRVGILGFSAGGHLAATAAVHFDRFTSDADDLAEAHSARPDVAVLCYPVIAMGGPLGHGGSRNRLLGDNADPEVVALLDTHTQVTKDTPPTFLWHTADDPVVKVQGALAFAAACREHRVPVELHVYESGRHGLGLAADHPDLKTWTEHCVRFLKRHFKTANEH